MPFQSLCNTLILPIVKPEGEYRVVQDLTVVVHIQPLLANHNILTQIPEDTTRVRVRSLVVSSGIWVNMLWLARRGCKGTTLFSLLGSKITTDGDCSHAIKRHLLLGRKTMTILDNSIIKKQRRYFANKTPSSPSYGFSSSHIWMWELDYKESWALKNWCFWTVVLEKTPESPLDYKEIQPVNPKGNQSWIFIGKTDAEAETSIIWPPVGKNWLIRKDPDAGKHWRQEKKGMTEDEMVITDSMASLTQWTRVWASSRSWWWTGKPSMLQSMGYQRVGHDWATELNWTEIPISASAYNLFLYPCM